MPVDIEELRKKARRLGYDVHDIGSTTIPANMGWFFSAKKRKRNKKA